MLLTDSANGGAASVDWGATPVSALRPTRIGGDGGVWLVPAGADAPAPGEPSIHLDASAAFGSGLHPTTRLCLERLAEWTPTEPLLDIGTGTGVLALYWLARGGPHAVGTDVDAGARAAAHRNAAANGFEDRLTITDQGPDDLERRYTRVVANIVAAPLIALAPRIVRALGPSARLLLSGVRQSQGPDVLAAYRRVGLRPSGEWTSQDWMSLELSTPW